jgi:hypothetical protein
VSNYLISALNTNHHILAALQGEKNKKEKEKGKTT